MRNKKVIEFCGKLLAIVIVATLTFGFLELISFLLCKAIDIEFSYRYAYLTIAFIACNYAFPFRIKNAKE